MGSEIQTRTIEIEARRSKDGNAFDAALSSEEIVDRAWGGERLIHTPEAIDLSRAKDGLPLLFNHNPNEPIGQVENIRIEGKRLRGRLRFGNSTRAQEVLADVKDGLLKGVSIGYLINKSQRQGDADIYDVTSWELIEASIAPIAADKTAGIGRSLFPILTLRGGAMNSNRDAIADEQKRIRDLENVGAQFKQFGGEELAEECIRTGRTLEDLNALIIARAGRKKVPSAEIGLNEEEIKEFSFVRALNALANPQDRRAQQAAGFEREVSDAAAQKAGRTARGFMVPPDVLGAATMRIPRRMMARDLTVGTATAGGHTVATELLAASFIDMLRNRSAAMSAGATVLNGLVGNIAIPRQTSGATAYWVPESSAPTESQQAFDQVTMSPKTVGAFTDYSRKLLIQSSIDVENFVRTDLAKIIALEVDRVALYGTGSSNQPMGVKNTTGINTKDFAAAAPTFAEVVDMETQVATDNADVGTLAYIVSATGRGSLKTTEKATGTGLFVWGDNNRVNTYEAFVSNQLESGDYWFGLWADILIGLWSGVDLLIDPYTQGTSGTVRVIAMQDVDTAVRHPESFCRGNNTL